jgi:hypothetical protein
MAKPPFEGSCSSWVLRLVFGSGGAGCSVRLNETAARRSRTSVDKTVAVTVGLSGLAAGTRYYWRYVATSAAGSTTGPARWFTTA